MSRKKIEKAQEYGAKCATANEAAKLTCEKHGKKAVKTAREMCG
jgi:hypothetical protein